MFKNIVKKIFGRLLRPITSRVRNIIADYQFRIANVEQVIYNVNHNVVTQSEDVKMQNARILQILNEQKETEILKDIKKSEFRVFSQWGDDGIIQFLVNYLDIKEKSFIEFGVENYKESNTRFLLMNNNWRGLIIDGSQNYMDQVRNSDLYWKYNLTAVNIFITKENVNTIFEENKFKGEIGLLHIDIDGNDYWVWKEVSIVKPVIVIVEYNSVFGINNPWTIPYKADFYRTDHHYSNLCFGSSLLSLCDLAKEKGYKFIGSNSAGNNAYFIRADKMKDLKELTPQEGYIESMFSESRNQDGILTYLRGEDRLKQIKGAQVYNTRTKKVEKI